MDYYFHTPGRAPVVGAAAYYKILARRTIEPANHRDVILSFTRIRDYTNGPWRMRHLASAFLLWINSIECLSKHPSTLYLHHV